MARMTISRAARAANVNVETIRFYERRGLVRQPTKPANRGAREYDVETVARIRFIRQAQEIGFSLREIAELLSLRADPGADCADVRRRAIEKRDEVEAKMVQLSRMRSALDDLIASCPGGGNVKACTILEAVQAGTGPAEPEAPRPVIELEEGVQGMKTTTLSIDGMHCDGCARTVETLLARLPGVRKAEASFDQRQARVLHDPAQASDTALVAALTKGGFTATAADP